MLNIIVSFDICRHKSKAKQKVYSQAEIYDAIFEATISPYSLADELFRINAQITWYSNLDDNKVWE